MAKVVKKASERRAEIIQAARKLFLEKDYESTTMQDMMKAVNIAKGTIYHYFQSKEDLLEAVVEQIIQEQLTRLQGALETAQGNALDQIKFLTLQANLTSSQPELIEQLHKPSNYTLHTRLLASLIIQIAPLYGKLIQKGCEEKLFVTDHPLEVAEFILAGLQFLTDQGIFSWTDEQIKRRMEAIPFIIEAMIKAQKGSFDFLSHISS